MARYTKIIKPVYYDGFACLGPECRYTCCQGWKITVMRKELSSLKKLPLCKDKEAKGEKLFKRVRHAPSDRFYANMVLNDAGLCPLLNEERLCSLQLSYGHQVIPRTCRLFPRHSGLVNGVLSMHLSLGCEAVLKLLFQHPQGISFKEEDITALTDETEIAWFVDEKETERRPVYSYDREITLACVFILQQRSLSLEDRMLLMGLVLERISKMEEEKQESQIPLYIKNIMEEIDKGGLGELFSQVKGDRKLQALNAIKLMDLFFKGMDRPEFLARIKKNLGIETEIRAEGSGLIEYVTVTPSALKKAEDNLGCFLSGWEYIMENIAVTWFSQMHMPFYFQDRSVWHNYILFAALFHMLQFLVMGYLDEERKPEDFIYAVTLCSRTLTHSKDRVAEILDHTLQNGATDLAHIAILVK